MLESIASSLLTKYLGDYVEGKIAVTAADNVCRAWQ